MFLIPEFGIHNDTKDFGLLFVPNLFAFNKDWHIVNSASIFGKVY